MYIRTSNWKTKYMNRKKVLPWGSQQDLEEKAITTAPELCKPNLWKRYIDNTLEKIKQGYTQDLTDHLNTIDKTGNVKSTHEEEKQGKIALLDLNIHHNRDGGMNKQSIENPLLRTKPNLWISEPPTAHELSVIRTLFEQKKMITEKEDRQQEEQHITIALKKNCLYPSWAINKGKQQTNRQKKESQKKKTDGKIKNSLRT